MYSCSSGVCIDIFASSENVVVLQFFYICGGTDDLGSDAFHHPWDFVIMYAFPPPHLVLHTLEIWVCPQSPSVDNSMVAGCSMAEVGNIPHSVPSPISPMLRADIAQPMRSGYCKPKYYGLTLVRFWHALRNHQVHCQINSLLISGNSWISMVIMACLVWHHWSGQHCSLRSFPSPLSLTFTAQIQFGPCHFSDSLCSCFLSAWSPWGIRNL